MMGERTVVQEALFYSFSLEDHVPRDHLLRSIDRFVDLGGAVATAAEVHGTREVVAEQNRGGKMVKAVLHAADPSLRVRLITARIGKTTCAEHVSHLFEAGQAVLHRRMPELEARLLRIIAGGGVRGARAVAGPGGRDGLGRPRADTRGQSCARA
jgi:phage terminase large subunit-like protein